MKTAECIDILQRFNDWRRDDGDGFMPATPVNPRLAGEAIDHAIHYMKTAERLRK